MNILSIGNSFSQDAHKYLHAVARADGVALNTFNLYIGSCSLSTHYRNMRSGERAYTLEMNGESTGFRVSLEEALLNRDWDVVTVQQVSNLSVSYGTYQPYLNSLTEYIRRCVPQAKIAVHQTWAYEQDSRRLRELMGYDSHEEMFRDIQRACQQAAEDCGADCLIPSGELFLAMDAAKIGPLHRDTFHASLGLGRYALGLLWYAVLTGREIQSNTFAVPEALVSPQQQEVVKTLVTRLAAAANKN